MPSSCRPAAYLSPNVVPSGYFLVLVVTHYLLLITHYLFPFLPDLRLE